MGLCIGSGFNTCVLFRQCILFALLCCMSSSERFNIDTYCLRSHSSRWFNRIVYYVDTWPRENSSKNSGTLLESIDSDENDAANWFTIVWLLENRRFLCRLSIVIWHDVFLFSLIFTRKKKSVWIKSKSNRFFENLDDQC